MVCMVPALTTGNGLTVTFTIEESRQIPSVTTSMYWVLVAGDTTTLLVAATNILPGKVNHWYVEAFTLALPFRVAENVAQIAVSFPGLAITVVSATTVTLSVSVQFVESVIATIYVPGNKFVIVWVVALVDQL